MFRQPPGPLQRESELPKVLVLDLELKPALGWDLVLLRLWILGCDECVQR